jgi:hypothetical protein
MSKIKSCLNGILKSGFPIQFKARRFLKGGYGVSTTPLLWRGGGGVQGRLQSPREYSEFLIPLGNGIVLTIVSCIIQILTNY